MTKKTPAQVSKSLKRTASYINRSKSPNRKVIQARLAKVITGSAEDFRQALTGVDSYVGAVDDFIEGLKMWNMSFVKDMGYEDLNALRDASEQGAPGGKEALEYYETVNKAASLVEKTLSGIMDQLDLIDEEADAVTL